MNEPFVNNGKRVGPGSNSVVASLLTNEGCDRELNEDCSRHIHPGDPKTLAAKGVLTIIADGMGGHSAGEVASRIAVEVIARVYYEDSGGPEAALEKAFHEANRKIYEASLSNQGRKGMGTTCTALVLRNGSALCAHVGDSRLYLIRGGQIYVMTEEHSVVMDMVRRGLISPEVARHHPDKNLITRALGSDRQVKVSAWQQPFPVRPGDHFLICSDGLYDMVEDEEMKRVALGDEPAAACGKLIALARQRGGHDNITVGIVRVQAGGSAKSKTMPDTRDLEVPSWLAMLSVIIRSLKKSAKEVWARFSAG